MRTVVFLVLSVFYIFVSSTDVCAQEASELENRQVIILASSKSYQDVLAKAKDLSLKTGMVFSTREMIYDDKRGLILPDNHEDESYAGSYYLRRYNNDCGNSLSECLSIEKSDAYEGFTPGLYILVAGIHEEGSAELSAKLAQLKKTVPDAYAKKTKIFMGCMH